MTIRERLEQWKRCIESDDFSKSNVVRSNFNDLYLILAEVLEQGCVPQQTDLRDTAEKSL